MIESPLHCPHCGSTEISSFDTYIGNCPGKAYVDENGEYQFDPGGETEINWDSCEEQGLQCRSCWEQFQLEEMVTEKDAPQVVAMHAWQSLQTAHRQAVNSGAFSKDQLAQIEHLADFAYGVGFPREEVEA